MFGAIFSAILENRMKAERCLFKLVPDLWCLWLVCFGQHTETSHLFQPRCN